MVGVLLFCTLLSAQPAAAPTADADLDVLLEKYKSYGLPLPPKGAIPVVFRNRFGGKGISFGRSDPIVVFKYLDTVGNTKFLYGTVNDWKAEDYEETDRSFEDEDVREFLWQSIPYSDERGARDISQDDMLATGIQAYSLGYDDLAQFLVTNERGIRFESNGWYRTPPESNSELRVTYLALHDGLNDWFDTGQDRKEVGERILAIIDNVKFRTASSSVNKYRDEYIEDLKRTIAPREPSKDPVEQMIERLLDERGSLYPGPPETNTKTMKQIIEMGADALPVLQKHLKDRRLTRISFAGMNNGPAGPWRLSSVISDLIYIINKGER